MPAKIEKLKGINLGGWLVLEKWITPSLFNGSGAGDEYGLCLDLNSRKQSVISSHRNKFIGRKDFKSIAEAGFNAVRLPVGHWIFGNYRPYVKTEKYVDKALEWAAEFDLMVIIDLHTAPGSQNGKIHSGREGAIGWHLDDKNIRETLEITEKIAKTYGQHPNLYGIEPLNEPDREIPLSLLQDYYKKAYQLIRKHCPSRVAVIFSDAYRPQAEWEDFIKSSGMRNVLLDMHFYQVFSETGDKKIADYLEGALNWKDQIEIFGAENILVGEWGLALHKLYDSMNSYEAAAAEELYSSAQQYAFSNTAGNFLWTYKTEDAGKWSWLKHNN